MLRKHDRPAESHIRVNGKTKIITFVLLKGYMEFYCAFLPFLSETKAQLFIITFLFLPFLLGNYISSSFITFLFLPFLSFSFYFKKEKKENEKINTVFSNLFIFFLFFPKYEFNSLKLLFFFFLFFPWMHFFMMEKIIFFTFHLCKKLGILI